MDASTHRDNKWKDRLNEDSATVAVAVESSPSSAVRRRRRRRRRIACNEGDVGASGVRDGLMDCALQLELHSTPPRCYAL